jgi:dTDP-4-amino-4,6-dideoxygalactose transaminase
MIASNLFFVKEVLEYTPWFAKESIRLNIHTNLTEEELKEVVNKFKGKFDEIELKEI